MLSKVVLVLSSLVFLTAPVVRSEPTDPTSDTQQFGGMKAHKPGLKVRMTQAFSDLIKENLL